MVASEVLKDLIVSKGLAWTGTEEAGTSGE